LEQPIRVRILDYEYLIRSDEDEAHVLKIAEYVNEKLRDIRDNTEGLSEKKTALLAAFHIASEYFQILKRDEELRSRIEARAQALNTEIDSIIHGRA